MVLVIVPITRETFNKLKKDKAFTENEIKGLESRISRNI